MPQTSSQLPPTKTPARAERESQCAGRRESHLNLVGVLELDNKAHLNSMLVVE